ncbi:hypothetical protein H2202_002447 [Exophiala xenobiotica]|nr:hypothetical protein H2202_002447 [Exophiala xenobiotica]KAK5234668.1 hypothetical protein LTR47_004111 [Exophiala xenobiotica]KAK5246763.1 hypothetical protein LTS06_008023 [Exophiala xenobiotica]KAK5326355.1 hypothetical protein LTR93_003217 [Exophiala xenobiotica]KAK5353045.1 hypothetical protein LTR61_003002 [Exophiala xenobiotica]
MESSGDKEWASKYLLDPLNAPEPSQEDGPGNAFRGGPSVVPAKAPTPGRTLSGRRLSKNNPYRKTSLSDINATEVKRSASLNSNGNARNYPSTPPSSYPSPPPSANTPTGTFSSRSPRSPSHRQEAFGEPTSGRRRGSSLTERFPGDMSHRPLDTLAKQKHIADRSRHATKKHHIKPDTIDSLDNSGGAAWHHGGPYDATLYARNNTVNSPVAALAQSNAEALKATPKEKIIDSVVRHRPLDGVATYAPGDTDRMGNVYNYQEGDNMMTEGRPEGGAYKRWPGVQYLPEDIKGKGEPSYSIEKALKGHHIHDEKVGADGIEMETKSTRNRSSSGALPPSSWDDGEGQLGRSGSFKRLSGGLKKRFGSIKKRSPE